METFSSNSRTTWKIEQLAKQQQYLRKQPPNNHTLGDIVELYTSNKDQGEIIAIYKPIDSKQLQCKVLVRTDTNHYPDDTSIPLPSIPNKKALIITVDYESVKQTNVPLPTDNVPKTWLKTNIITTTKV